LVSRADAARSSFRAIVDDAFGITAATGEA
jgi:hypothetical protein